jgi:hypothetical protein
MKTDDLWIIPLIIPFTGHRYRVTVQARRAPGPFGGTSGCAVFAINNQGGGYTGAGMGAFVGFPQTEFQAVVLTRNIPVFGSDDRGHGGPATLQVNCNVGRPPPDPAGKVPTNGGALLSVQLVNLD